MRHCHLQIRQLARGHKLHIGRVADRLPCMSEPDRVDRSLGVIPCHLFRVALQCGVLFIREDLWAEFMQPWKRFALLHLDESYAKRASFTVKGTEVGWRPAKFHLAFHRLYVSGKREAALVNRGSRQKLTYGRYRGSA